MGGGSLPGYHIFQLNLLPLFSIAETRSGSRPETASGTGSQRAPHIAAATDSGSAPPLTDAGRPAINITDDRALVPYQAEASSARYTGHFLTYCR
jgi:hypothetical protein